MKTIRLFGALGRKFGRVHHFDVRSAAEAVRALVANFPSFEQHLLTAPGGYVVRADGDSLGERELQAPVSREIKIIPRLVGAGGPQEKILIGAVLIMAGVIVSGASFGGAAPLGAALVSTGISFMVGGVAQFLTPTPRLPEMPERPENKPSYVFNGPVNTTAQGNAVPVGYGRLVVGSAVISAGLSSEALSV